MTDSPPSKGIAPQLEPAPYGRHYEQNGNQNHGAAEKTNIFQKEMNHHTKNDQWED